MTQPTDADLRTLTAKVACDAPPGQQPCANCTAAAVRIVDELLPTHRRLVLTETAADLRRRADNVPWSDPTLRRGIQYAASVLAAQTAAQPAVANAEPIPGPGERDRWAKPSQTI